MFAGIIEDIGEVLEIKKNGDKVFYISTKINYQELKIGSSISCNGICLTIIKKGKKNKKNWFAISASKETLSKMRLELILSEIIIWIAYFSKGFLIAKIKANLDISRNKEQITKKYLELENKKIIRC